MKRFFANAAAAVTLLALFQTARADVVLDRHGAVAFLHSDRLRAGDAQTFQRLISSSNASGVRIIYLDSMGGHPPTAVAIGRMIRRKGLDTAYNVSRGRCVSACTNLFLGGVHRYYIGGAGVADGIATHVGLGFHPSHGGAAIENLVLAYFREMGVPHAAELRYHIYPRAEVLSDHSGTNLAGDPRRYRLFFVSGSLALKTGVATSLSEPADPELQDHE
jgi:hypothetical protein